MNLTVLGSGTSTGVPVIGCDCSVCTSKNAKNQRQRASILVQIDQTSLVIDVGPDFRTQALKQSIHSLNAVVLTHGHADHILGLDDLRPLSFRTGLDVWCDKTTLTTIQKMFSYFFTQEKTESSRPTLTFHTLEPGKSINIGAIEITPIRIHHGKNDILGFRIGPLAYLTDCSGIPEESLPLLKNLDHLFLGALRWTPHPTHFSIDQAVAMAQTIKAKNTWLTHLGHELDHETTEQRLPQGIKLAYDGLKLNI